MTRQEWLDQGRCPLCRAHRPVRQGEKMCPMCREHRNAYARERYHTNRAMGRCVQCGDRVLSKGATCERCRLIVNGRALDRYYAKKEARESGTV